MKKSSSTKATALLLAVFLSAAFSVGTVSSTEAGAWGSINKSEKPTIKTKGKPLGHNPGKLCKVKVNIICVKAPCLPLTRWVPCKRPNHSPVNDNTQTWPDLGGYKKCLEMQKRGMKIACNKPKFNRGQIVDHWLKGKHVPYRTIKLTQAP